MKVVRDTPQDKGIPEILWDVKDIFQVTPADVRGVYFLFLNEEIVYIGQSTNVYTRIQAHVNQGEKVFNKVFVQIVPEEINLLAVEKHWILKYRPRYNYETHAKTCEREPSLNDIAYELNRVCKVNKVDQVWLKEACEQK
jgi:hypothetical protein